MVNGEECENEEVKSEERDDKETAERLSLWNPRSACNWSVLFTPVFGSYILSKNWLVLGDEQKAKNSMTWFYISIVYLLIIPFVTIPPPFGRLGPLGLILVWYLTSGKHQMEYVSSNTPDYEHKSWSKALSVGACALVLYFGIIFGYAALTAPTTNEIIESNSTSLVNQIVHEQFKQSVNCTHVKVVEKTGETSFLAHAFMDDNTVREIKVTFDGTNIYVEVPSEALE